MRSIYNNAGAMAASRIQMMERVRDALAPFVRAAEATIANERTHPSKQFIWTSGRDDNARISIEDLEKARAIFYELRSLPAAKKEGK